MKKFIVLTVISLAFLGQAMAQDKIPASRQEEGRAVFAVKTNLLYDLGTVLNYSLELPLGNHFSLAWENYCAWWAFGNRASIEYLTLGGEARWWIAPRKGRLTGHFLGAYGFWGRTDLQVGTLGGYQVPTMWSAGLRYGYSFRLSKGWHLELSLAGGFLRADYQHYTPAADWSVLWRDPENTGILSFWGPTNVSVTLVKTFRITPKAK